MKICECFAQEGSSERLMRVLTCSGCWGRLKFKDSVEFGSRNKISETLNSFCTCDTCHLLFKMVQAFSVSNSELLLALNQCLVDEYIVFSVVTL
jgi:hypothetical protein